MSFVRQIVRISTAFLCVVAFVGTISGTATAYTTFRIVNALPDVTLCVTPYGGRTANGTPLVQWTCTWDPSQDWRYVETSWGDLIVNNKSGRCLTPSGGGVDNGTYLTLWDCDSNKASQKWGLDNSAILENLNSGKYITPYGGGSASGTRLTLWSWTGSVYQHWFDYY